ncbi:MATE family efflux transporter [Pisciglobus halotolerans]|uniref:Putative efflux protein, MATE family n=1 Tax=Pisciglobus halotolerans TaxID=745365 RepID=A0A1I3ATQ4_9LACT|nr:MATE family efflux transporter [Pisciglobus halotolerans]SFH52731.1 putative efflux protein, MATE family [Pisciglobus halotolerans]
MENIKENKMGILPVNRLILSMSVPMMVSMLIQSLYNIVDSIFVAQINEEALTAVSLAFPVQNLLIAVQVGTGVGMNALLSRQLGEKNKAAADRTAANGVFLALAHYAVFLVLGLTAVTLFFRTQTTDPVILNYGKTYLMIVMCFSIGQFIQVTYERLLQSTGQTIYTMYTQGLGAIINIILDPIFIFGLLGFPKMGMAGAAWATVIGQVIAASAAIYFHHRKNTELSIDYKSFKPDKKTIKGIYNVGIPSMVMVSITSVTTYSLNVILMTFSSTATAVYGVYYKLQSFVFMPVFGLNNGMIPILAYNYGARKKERMVKIIAYSIAYAMGIMLFGLVIFQVFPEQLLNLFNASPEMMTIGMPALRTISLSFILAGFSVICSTVYQAFGRGFLSLAISVCRQLVVLVPAAYLFSLSGNIKLVWWSYPIAELISAVLCVIFLRYIYKKYIKNINTQSILR